MKLLTGRVLECYGSSYTVLYRSRTYSCVLRGRFRQTLKKEQNPIAVGDRVRFTVIDSDNGAIEELLPRRNKISRPTKRGTMKEKVIVSNVDQIIAVTSAKSPVFKPNLADRMLLVAERESLSGIICINKCDLIRNNEIDDIAAIYRRLRYRVFLTSALTGDGVDEFRESLKGKFSVFIGQSGVGKSSLLNKMQPGLNLKVQEVSRHNEKGKHTTSYTAAVHCDFGALIADSPGFRDFGLWGIDKADLWSLYREFRRYNDKCKFSPCTHTHEPDCAVRDAYERGIIAESRYVNYCRIFESFSEERF